MKRVLMFGGQGSQRIGMLNSYEKKWPNIIKKIYNEANDALGFNFRNLLKNINQEELNKTSIAQPILLLHSHCVMNILKNEIEFSSKKYDFVMGHSLGEYSALLASNSISFKSAIKLVRQRGMIMEECMKKKTLEMGMAAIFPISKEKANLLATKATELSSLTCQVANYNSPKQCVLSGYKEAIKKAISIGKLEKIIAKGTFLQVNTAFHSSILKENGSVDMFKEYLNNNIKLNKPSVPLISNVTGIDEINEEQIVNLLAIHMYYPVQWENSIHYVYNNLGVREFIEIGYGNVLTSLMRQFDFTKNISSISIGTADELINFIHLNNNV